MTMSRKRVGLALLTATVLLSSATADLHAQAADEATPDSFLVEGAAQEAPRNPISYFTTYDLNISRSTWTQNLSYNHTGKRFTLGASGATNVLTPIRGLETEGRDGSITGNISFIATKQWVWNLNGLFDMSSNEDARSSTKRRQNKVQARTSYTKSLLPGLTGTALAFTELQQEQGLSRKSIPPDTLARDSTYTSGRRDGVSGKLTWSPGAWLAVNGLAAGNWNHLTTNTQQRKFAPVITGGMNLVSDSLSSLETPTGDERYEASASYRGIPRLVVNGALRSLSGTQTMWAFARRGLDALSWYDRSANLKVEHTPVAGGGVTLEGSFGQVYRSYRLQDNFNTLGRTHSGSANFFLFRTGSRLMGGLQLNRVRNDLQKAQNGLVVNRAANLSGARKMTDRLWLEGAGTVSLFTRKYDDPIADRDDLRGYANVGGGYRVSSRCSTAVHFSVNRSHAVAIDAAAAAENNVQTSYQMDAALRLQVTQSFQIWQNYQINANYFVYDFDFQEDRNSLTRIRRIDTVLSDSLFDFAILRLTHNFQAQDRGTYSRSAEGGDRKYGVSQEFYVQNLSITVGIRPLEGVSFLATQSLGNSRNYFYAPRAPDTKRNRWNLNLTATVDRTLPGDLSLQGSVQRIGEYTEADEKLPRRDEVDYWLAVASLQKNF